MEKLHSFSQAVERIYDCAVDPSGWDATMNAIREFIGSETAVLSLVDTKRHQILLVKDQNMEPGWEVSQAPYFEEQNSFLERSLQGLPSLDEPIVISRFMTREEQTTSPYLTEWSFPRGFTDLASMILMHTHDRHSRLDLGFRQRQGVVSDLQVHLMRLLLPHIRRAVMISDILDIRTIERNTISETLNLLRYAVLITDENSRILHANAAGETMLRAGVLIRGSGGFLKGCRPRAASELEIAIRLAAKDETELGKTGLAVVLTPPDTPPSVAHVLPLARGDCRTRLQPAAAAAVFIGQAADLEASARRIGRHFDLTPAETKVLSSLLSGQTLTEAAESLGVSVNTTRTHLANIFAKTCVSRQADLIRLAAQMEKFVPAG